MVTRDRPAFQKNEIQPLEGLDNLVEYVEQFGKQAVDVIRHAILITLSSARQSHIDSDGPAPVTGATN